MIARRMAFLSVVLLAAQVVSAAPKIDVTQTIEARKQAKDWGCWATATVMLWNWKNAIAQNEEGLTSSVGKSYRTLYDNDTRGVTAEEEAAFYKALNLSVIRGQNPTIARWASLLAKGPLSVTIQNDATTYHALVVYGMSGDGTASKTTVSYVDPFDGSRHDLSFADFVKLYEGGADWPLQIVHW